MARGTAKLIGDRNDTIDYEVVIHDHPWIIERNLDCVISPDSDGVLCGLLMSHYLGWHIRGFYDTTALAIEDGIEPRNVVFLDAEIYRAGVRSIGNHMLMYRKEDLPKEWTTNFTESLAINNLRGHQFEGGFSLKYPFATIHLLLAFVARSGIDIPISRTAIDWLLFADGTFQNLFRYPENCTDWLRYLHASQEHNPLRTVFYGEKYDLYEMVTMMQRVWRKRDDVVGAYGDKFPVLKTDDGGNFLNIQQNKNTWGSVECQRTTWEKFTTYLGVETGWLYAKDRWSWGNWRVFRFTKRIEKNKNKIGITKYRQVMNMRPLSWAITANDRVEYTIEKPDQVF